MDSTKKGRVIKTIVFPAPFPTWNRLLAANRWQRAKIRHWIHDAVKDIVNGVKISGERLEEYYSLIRPTYKKKSTGKKKRRSRKR